MPLGPLTQQSILQLAGHIITQAYQQGKLPQPHAPALYQTITNMINQRSQKLFEMFQYVEQRIPAAAMGQEINVNDSNLYNVIREYLNVLINQMLSGAQSAQPGFYPQQQQGYGQPVYGAPASAPAPFTSNLYTTSGAPQAQVQTTQQPTTVRMEELMPVKPTVISLVESSTASFSPMVDKSIENISYALGDSGGVRVGLSKFILRRAVNSVDEAHRHMQRIIPSDYRNGLWMHYCVATRLVHIPMKTEKFLSICTQFDEEVHDRGWQAGIKVINDITMSRSELLGLDELITSLVNYQIGPQLHIRNSNTLAIEEMKDFDELRKVNKAFKASMHPDYTVTVDDIINRVFRGVFDQEIVIKRKDPHIGDFIHCEEVTYYENGTTEYDYGNLPDRAASSGFIDALFDKHTVLRVPTRFAVTNIIDLKRLPNHHAPYYIDSDPGSMMTSMMLKLPDPEAAGIRTIVCVDSDSKDQVIRRFGQDLNDEFALYW